MDSDAAASIRGLSWISPPHRHASRSLSCGHHNNVSAQRLVVYMMTSMIAALISIPNSNHHLVQSLSIISKLSTHRPTNHVLSRYEVNIIRGIVQPLTKFPTLLFQADTDMTENEKNEASSSAANTSSASDDDSKTATAATPTIDRTSFDDAGRSLLDEQDMKRMNEMGDFDVNPNVCTKTMVFLFLSFFASDTFDFYSFCGSAVIHRSDGADAGGDPCPHGIHGYRKIQSQRRLHCETSTGGHVGGECQSRRRSGGW